MKLLGNPNEADTQWLIAVGELLRQEREEAGLTEPIRNLRLVRPLPACHQAKDGRSFRYVKALKNASSTLVRILLDVAGEPYVEPMGESIQGNFAKEITHQGRTEYVALNNGKLRLHLYHYESAFAPEPMADIRFCVVRDPLERFVSTYQNRIARLGEETSLEEFAEQLNPQGDNPYPQDKHFTKQTYYLGNDVGYYTHIFTTEQLADLLQLLEELAGKKLTLHRRNVSAHYNMPTISAPVRAQIEKVYAADYQVFGDYFRA